LSPPQSYLKSEDSIVFGDSGGKDGTNTLNAIIGLPVKEGGDNRSLGDMIGLHNRRNRLTVDELQMSLPVVHEAWDNLSIGEDASFLGMGNPYSRMDPLGTASEPEAGWESIDTSMEEWKTKKGWCLYFDGLKSPGVDDPEKFPMLLNQEQIDDMRRDPGEDSIRFWSQRRGFIPKEGMVDAVIPESYIYAYHTKADVIWKDQYEMVFGCDPAFSTGGDRCVLRPAKYGTSKDGVFTIKLEDPILIQLRASSDKTLTIRLRDDLIKKLAEFGATVDNLAIDSTSSHSALADILDQESQCRCHRVYFGGAASDNPISKSDPIKCSQAYANRVTELYYVFRQFVMGDQIRGLDDDGIKELCSRRLDDRIIDKGDDVKQVKIENKKKFKKRAGRSPDIADATVIVVDYIRNRLGVVPGRHILTKQEQMTQSVECDLEAQGDLYGSEQPDTGDMWYGVGNQGMM